MKQQVQAQSILPLQISVCEDDVQNLLEGGAELIKMFVKALPYGTVLVIIGGSPCQDLSAAGPLGGVLGFTGRNCKKSRPTT